jgi:hypothetical protein
MARLYTAMKGMVFIGMDSILVDCERLQGGRCHNQPHFKMQPSFNHTYWIPPNVTLGEGPVDYGLEHPSCLDCVSLYRRRGWSKNDRGYALVHSS